MSPTTQGILFKLGSTVTFAMMVTAIKLTDNRVPSYEVLSARAFFGIIPILIYMLARGEFPHILRTRNVFGHFKRAVVGTMSMLCWFSGLALLPLPDSTAIGYSGPLFAVLFAAVILGENVRAYRWTAVAVGFTGVLIVLSEHVSGFGGVANPTQQLGAVLTLGSAVFAALATTQVRELTATEPTSAIVFYFSVSAAGLSLIGLTFGWVMPSGSDAVLLISAGLLGGVGQVLMTTAYSKAEASIIAPFDYANMLWIIAVSYFVFGDVPTQTVIIGSAIVIASGIFVIWRERQLGLRKRAALSPR